MLKYLVYECYNIACVSAEYNFTDEPQMEDVHSHGSSPHEYMSLIKETRDTLDKAGSDTKLNEPSDTAMPVTQEVFPIITKPCEMQVHGDNDITGSEEDGYELPQLPHGLSVNTSEPYGGPDNEWISANDIYGYEPMVTKSAAGEMKTAPENNPWTWMDRIWKKRKQTKTHLHWWIFKEVKTLPK